MDRRRVLLELYRAALRAVDARDAVARALRVRAPTGERIVVLAAGKAAVPMLRGALDVLGERVARGLAVTREGTSEGVDSRIVVREAAHPLPDARSVRAAQEALAEARALRREDVLLVMLSGGASALWTAPAPGLQLEDKRRATELLLRAGADIRALNTVRKHLSAIKGGGLARAAAPARVVTLAVSDVAGDALDAIGSGPTAPDPTRFADALAVLREHGLGERVPAAVLRHLERGARGELPENPGPDDPWLAAQERRVVARLDDALAAAQARAQEAGLRVVSLGRALDSEVRGLARRLAQEVRRARERGADLLLAGGEPTVVVRGPGLGGRAQELALAFAREMEGDPAVALFAGTDGSDGPTDAAGSFADGATLARGRARGLDPELHLRRNDAHPFLEASGDLLRTGPTGTNVNDLALILIR